MENNNWQPFTTAPKDGNYLRFIDNQNKEFPAYWHASDCWIGEFDPGIVSLVGDKAVELPVNPKLVIVSWRYQTHEDDIADQLHRDKLAVEYEEKRKKTFPKGEQAWFDALSKQCSKYEKEHEIETLKFEVFKQENNIRDEDYPDHLGILLK